MICVINLFQAKVSETENGLETPEEEDEDEIEKLEEQALSLRKVSFGFGISTLCLFF